AAAILLAAPLVTVPAASAQDSCARVTLQLHLVNLASRQNFDRAQDLLLLTLALGQPAEAPTVALCSAAARDRDPDRTDQQTGASSSAGGSVTLTDKTGIADFLNLALEHGAIAKTTSGTHYTLQTTPYMFYTGFGGNDRAESWDKLAVLR